MFIEGIITGVFIAGLVAGVVTGWKVYNHKFIKSPMVKAGLNLLMDFIDRLNFPDNVKEAFRILLKADATKSLLSPHKLDRDKIKGTRLRVENLLAPNIKKTAKPKGGTKELIK